MTLGISTILCMMYNCVGQPRGAREGVAPRDRVITSCQHILAQPVKFHTYSVGIKNIIMSGFLGCCFGQILGCLDGGIRNNYGSSVHIMYMKYVLYFIGTRFKSNQPSV